MDLPLPQIDSACELLTAGELVAFPTETVYGLGADATNDVAVKRIFAAKGRPSNNPLILHFASLSDILNYVEVPLGDAGALLLRRLHAAATLWPGPLSIVLPRGTTNSGRAISDAVCAGGQTIAVRIPDHPIALELLRRFGRPLAAPSANPSNYVSPTTAAHVEELQRNDGVNPASHLIRMVIDGGPCRVGVESTVLSLVHEQPTILRPGGITREALSEALGEKVIAHTGSQKPPVQTKTPSAKIDQTPLLSPGMLAKHYSPRTAVVLRPDYERSFAQSDLGVPQATHGNAAKSEKELNKRRSPLVGAIRFDDQPTPFPCQLERCISTNGKPEDIASKLFATLREFDSMGLELIVVDTCEPVGLGEAIMDRLIRAVSP